MFTLYFHELKRQLKTTLIWSLSVALFGMICILMYSSMEEQIGQMAESFAQMGAFSDAFGMNELSMATMTGYFATEIGTIHGIGMGIFAASLATVVLSKEEDAHTGEYLYSLPVSRVAILVAKVLSVVTSLVAFSLICFCIYEISFAMVDSGVEFGLITRFIVMQLMMGIEISSICLVISACSRTNKLGAGIGVAMGFYAYDLMARILPDLKDYIGLGAYSFANASDIFKCGEINGDYLLTGVAVAVVCLFLAGCVFNRKDFAS